MSVSLYCYQAIDAVSVEDDHKVIDLYVLFVLYSVCSRRKAVRNLLMAKVKSGLFTSRLITEMFNCRIPVSRVCSTIFLYLICIFSGTQ